MKTIIATEKELISGAAGQIKQLLKEKPKAVLALSAGRTTRGLYAELVRMVEAGEISFREAKVFAVTEYEETAPELSCRWMLEETLLNMIDILPENCYFLSDDTMDDYDKQIQTAGGLDLAVLGLGLNAHIGFNEPATPFSSGTHRQKLTDATKREKAGVFGSAEAVPAFGLTMGIRTLTSAREILLMALGEEKAEAVFKMLYGRNDSAVPAAFLQIPLNVTVYLDEAAAKKL